VFVVSPVMVAGQLKARLLVSLLFEAEAVLELAVALQVGRLWLASTNY
jgi:hypothetical protein